MDMSAIREETVGASLLEHCPMKQSLSFEQYFDVCRVKALRALLYRE